MYLELVAPTVNKQIITIIIMLTYPPFYLHALFITGESDCLDLLLLQGWAINSYQGPHESHELCQRATNFLLLRE